MAIDNYVGKMPYDMWQAAGLSFVVTFATSTLLTGNPALGMVAGTAMGLCSLISSVTTPIFKDLWKRSTGTEEWYQYGLRTFVVLAIGGFAAAQIFSYQFDLVVAFAIAIAIHVCRNSTLANNLNRAQIFVVP